MKKNIDAQKLINKRWAGIPKSERAKETAAATNARWKGKSKADRLKMGQDLIKARKNAAKKRKKLSTV